MSRFVVILEILANLALAVALAVLSLLGNGLAYVAAALTLLTILDRGLRPRQRGFRAPLHAGCCSALWVTFAYALRPHVLDFIIYISIFAIIPTVTVVLIRKKQDVLWTSCRVSMTIHLPLACCAIVAGVAGAAG